jgi:type IV pilus assembly protein PilM
MLELFKTKKNHFVGVDFGTSSIKVVELSYADQKTSLENYGIVDLNLGNHSETRNSSFERTLNDSLRKLIEKMNIKTVASYVSIPGFSGLIAIIELPEMPEDELAKAIQFEAHKYIPSALDEIALSWEVVEKKTNVEKTNQGNGIIPKLRLKNDPGGKAGKKTKVLLVAAPKKDIERYDRLVSGVGLKVKAIELETFSIARSLVGDEGGTFLIVDIGSRATNIILVEKGVIQVNRNIDAGGDEITAAIVDTMSISRSRAEIFKKGEKDILNGNESAIIIPVLDLIVGELRRITTAYKEKKRDSSIDALILSGGTSKMKGIEEYFTHAMEGEKIRLGNPWRSVVVSNEAAPFVKELGSSFAVALGLALRGVEDYKRK